jgi:CPA1 family monovalent cation:H+ antiporter
MELLPTLAVLLALGAAFSFFNERLLKWESSIALTLCTLVVASIIAGLEYFDWPVTESVVQFVADLEFSRTFLNIMLCFLLFAGALDVSIAGLERERWIIAGLAVFATAVATFAIGTLAWLGLSLIGVQIPWVIALLFGAVISPTDPIASLAILKGVGLPRRLGTLINGESLFNDGVGVVLVILITGVASGEEGASFGRAVLLFGREVFGAVLLGSLVGWVTHLLLENVKSDTSRLLVSLAAVTGVFALGELLAVSALIATVILGLIVGNFSLHVKTGRKDLMPAFWKALDDILNAVLFVLIGLQALVVRHSLGWGVAVIAVPSVLMGRWVSVALPVAILKMERRYAGARLKLINLLTWSGLRGGLSVALAMSLSDQVHRELIIVMTYGAVCFSILVQGSTISRLFPKPVLMQIEKEV